MSWSLTAVGLLQQVLDRVSSVLDAHAGSGPMLALAGSLLALYFRKFILRNRCCSCSLVSSGTS